MSKIRIFHIEIEIKFKVLESPKHEYCIKKTLN